MLGHRLRLTAALVALVALGGLVVWFAAHGGRLLHVRTASMGSAAPVGSLVVTSPTDPSGIRPGELVSFRPGGDTGSIVTHRVLGVDTGGLITKGDNNPAPDPWRVSAPMIVGRSVAVVPALGAALNALPPMLLGVVIVVAAARRTTRSPTVRRSVLIAGIPLVAAVVLSAQRPLVGVVSLGTSHDPAEATLTSDIVSTGLVPSTIRADRGETVVLRDGDLHRFVVPVTTGADRVTVHASPSWSGPWLAGAAAVTLSPLVCAAVLALRHRGSCGVIQP